MLPQLTATEARIIGCLMEKSVTTPDQYPLTLNALTNACNQKSAREPVMALKPAEVQRAARELKTKSLLHIEENFRTGAEKYKQRLCNTAYNDLQLDSAGFAIVCLLLLRGPQTPGELRARSGRLHGFADNGAVVAAAAGLIDEDSEDSLIVELPRTHGRKDAEFMHQLSGPIDRAAYAEAAGAGGGSTNSSKARIAELEARVAELEAENRTLRAQLGASS
ncbi:YceH family protein [Salinisphaera aquimarina]|uniref:YceH family protein n=1 Tax=Salinisphaera aquimarina TaxID=2094031 RepID=A0ABV7EHY3_9GAMM